MNRGLFNILLSPDLTTCKGSDKKKNRLRLCESEWTAAWLCHCSVKTHKKTVSASLHMSMCKWDVNDQNRWPAGFGLEVNSLSLAAKNVMVTLSMMGVMGWGCVWYVWLATRLAGWVQMGAAGWGEAACLPACSLLCLTQYFGRHLLCELLWRFLRLNLLVAQDCKESLLNLELRSPARSWSFVPSSTPWRIFWRRSLLCHTL